MPLPIFPVHLFNPASVKAWPRARVIDGGTALNGDQDAISADRGGRWYIDFMDIQLRNVAQERAWGQWNSFLNGGATVVAVPVLTLRTAPRPMGGGRILRVGDLYADDPVFPTVVRYGSPYIEASLVGGLALGAVNCTINVTRGARLKGGEVWSYNNRAYPIERVLSTTGQVSVVKLGLPARESIPANASLNFEWPVAQARMVIGQDLAAAMSLGYGTTNISFVEDFSEVS